MVPRAELGISTPTEAQEDNRMGEFEQAHVNELPSLVEQKIIKAHFVPYTSPIPDVVQRAIDADTYDISLLPKRKLKRDMNSLLLRSFETSDMTDKETEMNHADFANLKAKEIEEDSLIRLIDEQVLKDAVGDNVTDQLMAKAAIKYRIAAFLAGTPLADTHKNDHIARRNEVKRMDSELSKDKELMDELKEVTNSAFTAKTQAAREAHLKRAHSIRQQLASSAQPEDSYMIQSRKRQQLKRSKIQHVMHGLGILRRLITDNNNRKRLDKMYERIESVVLVKRNEAVPEQEEAPYDKMNLEEKLDFVWEVEDYAIEASRMCGLSMEYETTNEQSQLQDAAG